MQGIREGDRLTPLPVGGRMWPLDIGWRRTGRADAARDEGVATLPEYGWSAASSSGSGVTLEGRFRVPAEATGRLLLRLDGVGCFARVRLDGREAATHIGSHGAWDCPLEARGGDAVDIALELWSGENAFSPYQTADIERGLYLVEVPFTHVSSWIARADTRDGAGRLTLEYALEGAQPGDRLTAELYAPNGDALGRWTLDPAAADARIEGLSIARWDAEHPALYRLALTLWRGDAALERLERRVGFTDIRMDDPRMLWNDRPLKLRGVNYREPLPREHRDLRAELLLLKDAHINFLRSMYAPYSEACLCLCDELGFYVEQCAPFQEVGQGIASTQNAPAMAEGYLRQFAEMLQGSISHPCVALWCLGGDSSWGSNFRHGYRLAKRLDPKRPVSFSYPMTVPEEEPALDIWSVAYVDWRQPMDERYDQMVIFHTHGAHNEIGYAVGGADGHMPVLHQAFAPPPCYDRDEVQRDPGIHEFWGEGIARFWDRMWASEGCLGGAVWAAADEDGTFSPRLKGFHWGLLDAQGRPKPEYHHVRMAYAPIALEGYERRGDALHLRIRNRFCHRSLAEVACRWRSGDAGGTLALSGDPGECAIARIERAGHRGAPVDLLFEAEGFSHRIAIPAEDVREPAARGIDGGPYALHEDGDRAVVANDRYRFVFDRRRGRLLEASAGGIALLADGPFLQTTRLTLGAWRGSVERIALSQGAARVALLGAYGDVCRVRFTLDIATDGTVDARADILTLSAPMPHAVKAGVGIDPGGLNEWGIAWLAAPGSEGLAWRRDALWGWYPPDHIGRAVGEARREDGDDFTSMKHHIRVAALRYPGAGIAVPGDECDLSVRIEEQEDPAYVLDDRDERIAYAGRWREMDDACGNFGGTESLSDEAGATATLRFEGSGVRVYGPLDVLYGEGEAAIDGGAPSAFCQMLERVDLLGASRGYEKRYGQLLYEAHGLPEGPHELRIAVKGVRPPGAQGCYVSLDRIVVEGEGAKRPVRLILNRDFNYARLVRGNHMRPPVCFGTGDSVRAAIRLYAGEADAGGRMRP